MTLYQTQTGKNRRKKKKASKKRKEEKKQETKQNKQHQQNKTNKKIFHSHPPLHGRERERRKSIQNKTCTLTSTNTDNAVGVRGCSLISAHPIGQGSVTCGSWASCSSLASLQWPSVALTKNYVEMNILWIFFNIIVVRLEQCFSACMF